MGEEAEVTEEAAPKAEETASKEEAAPAEDAAPKMAPPAGPPPDMKPPDMKPPDMKPPDMKPPDMKPPDMKPPDMPPPEEENEGENGTAEYDLPSVEILDVEADAGLLKVLQYKCLACGVMQKDASALLAHVQGRSHSNRLKNKKLLDDETIVATLQDLMELEKPHRELKRQQIEDKLAEKNAEKKGMTKEEWLEMMEKKKEERRLKIEAGEEVDPEEPDEGGLRRGNRGGRGRKRGRDGRGDDRGGREPKLYKYDPVRCELFQIDLETPEQALEHLSSDEFHGKADGYGCAICAEGTAEDPEFVNGEHWKSQHHREKCKRLWAMNLDPTRFGIRDDFADYDRTPYHCGVTNKIVHGYIELKEHLQSDEFAEKCIPFQDGCELCGFNSSDRLKVMQHYLSVPHFKRLHHLAFYGMDVSGYYIGY
eukprot:TRINITY_DN1665_c0_g1_i1.p1 TRINITY_DN1665_c0_g1~~TRINITY_DN1665_c0_g1_i1.p1  ORF type:complete len:424 (+),score=148.76 TRINITY_DN1665_c0_g1_i1:64-1335(+)